MTHKHARMTWTEANLSQMAFLQQALTTNCLGYFNKQWNTVLETDASPIGASSVLYQWNPEDKKERKVIAYWSKAFSTIELSKLYTAIQIRIQRVESNVLACG